MVSSSPAISSSSFCTLSVSISRAGLLEVDMHMKSTHDIKTKLFLGPIISKNCQSYIENVQVEKR